MITILFDLDGTLVDSSEGILDSLRHMLTAMSSPDRSDDELRSWIGPPLQQCAADLAGASTPEEVQAAVDAYRARYRSHGVTQTIPFIGIPELLDDLFQTGKVAMGVSTSKPTEFAQQIIRQHGLEKWLPVLSGADWAGKLSKADLVLQSLQRLRGDAERTEKLHQQGMAFGRALCENSAFAGEADALLPRPGEQALLLEAP